MKFLSRTYFLMPFLLLGACGPQPSYNNFGFDYNQAFLTETRRDLGQGLTLGSGYDVLTGESTGICASGTEASIGELSLKNSFNQSVPSEKLNELLGTNQGKYVNKKNAFAGTRLDSFLLPPTESFRKVYFFSLSLRGLSLVLEAPSFKEKNCLQAFIEKQNLGADILVKVDLYFSSQQAAEFFASEAHGASLKKLFQILQQTENLDGHMVSALQLGGIPDQFMSFAAEKLNGLVECNMHGNLKACEQIQDVLTAYALDKNQGLYKQILTGGPESSIVSYDWKELHSPLFSEQEEKTLGQIKVLSSHYRSLQTTLSQMEHWQSLIPVPEDYQEKWDKTKEDLTQEKILLEDKMLSCFERLGRCDLNSTQIKSVPFPKVPTFLYWCENSDAKVFKTLKATYTNRCSAILNVLFDSPHLNLANMEIEHIDFLENFPELESLNLKNNLVSDLTPLKTISGLTSLDVSENPLSREDIPPIPGLERLKWE